MAKSTAKNSSPASTSPALTPVRSVAEVFGAISRAKLVSSELAPAAFCTNFFPVESRIEAWIDHGHLFMEQREGAAFFFRFDRGFYHLHFSASSLEVLQRQMTGVRLLEVQRVVTDLVGPEASLQGLLAAHTASGFVPHRKLIRLSRTARSLDSAKTESSDANVELAQPSDAEECLRLIEAGFELYRDQVPLLYEVQIAIHKRQVLVIKSADEIGALLFFETQGMTSTVRFWVVAPRFRARRFGSALIRHYFGSQPAVRRFILWVAADNRDAIEKYAHYSYAPETLVDHVLVNRVIAHEIAS